MGEVERLVAKQNPSVSHFLVLMKKLYAASAFTFYLCMTADSL